MLFLVVATLVVTAAAYIAIGLVLVRNPASGRGTAYLLQQQIGAACVVLHSTDSAVWEAKTLAAWPPGRGLGTALGDAVIAAADRDGMVLQLRCTAALERSYVRRGFTVVFKRFGLRLMQRQPVR